MGSVVVLGTLALILGGLNLSFLVGRVQVLDDVGVEFLNLLLKRGEALNPKIGMLEVFKLKRAVNFCN